MVTWNCTGSPCPWGTTTANPAMVWPASVSPVSARLGYTATHAVYAPAAAVTGMTVTITSGSASIYAGAPDASTHRVVSNIATGQSFTITNVTAGEYVSVQSGNPFSFQLTDATTTTTGPATTTTTIPSSQPCSDPVTCDIVTSLAGYWYCTPNTPDCQYTDVWVAEAISWPSWAAYSSNNRTGYSDRTAYGADGQEIYPYMGPWADGCQVEVISGEALIVEWERGTDVYRQTEVFAGQVYTIDLLGSENSALIETWDYKPPISVRLTNCNPQPVPPDAPAPTTTTTSLPAGVTPLQAPMVTWSCTSNCPWGSPLSNPAIPWSASLLPISGQGSYSSSEPVYLPANRANGLTVTIWSGSAEVYVGAPSEQAHPAIAMLTAGESYVISGISDGDIVSVQSAGNFSYTFAPAP